MAQPQQDGGRSPEAQVRALFEDAESGTAKAFEQAVNTPSFGALLARTAENVAALSRIGNDLADLVLRNLRIAGRADITRLARQLHRSEDKLERVLQEVEQLRDQLAAGERATPATAKPSGPRSARAPSSNGRSAGAGRSGRSSTAKR